MYYGTSDAIALDIDAVKKLSFANQHVKTYPRGGILLKKNMVFKGETSALAEACESGQADMVRLLVKSGADVNKFLRAYSWQNERETPLMIAARTGSVEVISALLEAGADIDAQAKVSGRTALHYALIFQKSLLNVGRAGGRNNSPLRASPNKLPAMPEVI